MDQMNAQFFQINLEDYACPGFVSSSKAYYATLPQLQAFIEALGGHRAVAEDHHDLITAYREYLAGNTGVCHRVLYQNERLLTPAKLIGTKSLSLDHFQWEHINIWGFPYLMSCDHVETVHIWLKVKGGYVRCLSARFDGLKYDGYPLESRFWGFPCIIAEDGSVTFNRLAVAEKRFKTLQECQEDLSSFNETDFDFTEFCNDIFGDG